MQNGRQGVHEFKRPKLLWNILLKICGRASFSATKRTNAIVSLSHEVMLAKTYLSAAVKYLEFSATFSTSNSNSIYLTAPS